MLADFVLQLATGLTVWLLILSPASAARSPRPLVNPHFFRTQLLVVLGLSVGALLWIGGDASKPLLISLLVAAAGAFLGSVSWSLNRSPGGLSLLLVTAGALLSGQYFRMETSESAGLAGSICAALLLGAATSAMLLGHNYLIAPTMTMQPMYRLLGALAMMLVVRAALDGWTLGQWTREHDLGNLKADEMLWLPVRWIVGILAPAALTWMAWQTARIRSTQSATGILYVVVIFCFLGELTAQLVRPAGLTF